MRLLSWLPNALKPQPNALKPQSSSPPTATDVLNALNCNLSNYRRKQIIKTFMHSPHTHQLVDQACLLWLQQLGIEELNLTHPNTQHHKTSVTYYQETIMALNEVKAEIQKNDDAAKIRISEPTGFRGQRR